VRRFLEARRDEIEVDDVARAAFTIVQSVNALAHEAMVAPRDDLHGEALVDEATALIVGYLRAPRAPA
jgi:Tetracyclin repressor-like, C-terminal domain